MEKEFVNYEQSVALKELGFDEPCFGFHDPNGKFHIVGNPLNYNFKSDIPEPLKLKNPKPKDISAPTFSQAFRWFREKYGLKHDIDDDNVGTKFYYKIRSYTDKFDNYDDIIKPMREERDWSKIEFYSYEEAELACLIKLIEIVKEGKT